MKRLAGLMLVLVLVLAVPALGGCAAGPQKVTIDAACQDFLDRPGEWVVPAGAEVTITLTNNGNLKHSWVLLEQGYVVEPPFDAEDEQHILWKGEVEPGGVATFTFTAPSEPGEYPVVCAILGHMQHRDIGKLIVR